MIEATALALARRRADSLAPEREAIDAALRAGGYDPETVEPDAPQGHNEVACSNARAWNPAYLSNAELDARIEAWERALGGKPF